ncbi:hypothetical protein CRUP_031915 [Coryphaenoides rupestris]|nr:hypothetical protein CRUP_031915 [Coryphaenoides rupestris]
MFPWRWLALLALIPLALSTNAGVKVKLTEKGLEFGRSLVVGSLQEKLKTINVPDISGKQRVSRIGKVRYTLSGMRVVDAGLPKSTLGLVPGTGVLLSISNAFLNLQGNWRIRYKIIKDHGSFKLGIKDLTISASISVRSDETGRPAVAMASCTSAVGAVSIKFRGGASWLYNLFDHYIKKSLRSTLQEKICPLVADSVSNLNQYLKTLNVLAPVDKYAEIAYFMVSSPEISKSSIELSLKGEFYNIGHHLEPPLAPTPFFLTDQEQSMVTIGISAFTANSATFVYNKAGILSINITDDMLGKLFPGLEMKLQLNMVKDPLIILEANNVTLAVGSSVMAYAIHTNGSLSPLFVLNLNASVSGQVSVTEKKLAGAVTLNGMDMSLGKSYVGDFQVKSLQSILQLVLKVAVLPRVNAQLDKGYPLPNLGKFSLVNTQVQVLKGYILIGTDIKLT